MSINSFGNNNQPIPAKLDKPKDKETLIFDAASRCFKNASISSLVGAKHMSELEDVLIESLQNGDVLVYNGVDLVWENSDLSLGVPTRITSMVDVGNLPNPGQYIKWNDFNELNVDSELVYIDSIPLADVSGLEAILQDKTDKVIPAQAGTIATLSAEGDLVDSEISVSDLATAAQGALADTSLQPGANVSTLTNDSSFIAAGDNISALTNDAEYISSLSEDQQPVLSANLSVNDHEIQSAPAGDIVLTLVEATLNKGHIYLDVFRLPNADGDAGDILSTDGEGNLTFVSPEYAAPIATVFGRTGDILPTVGDYDAQQITNTTSVPGATLHEAIETLGGEIVDVMVAGDNISELNNDLGYLINLSSQSILNLSDTPNSYITNSRKFMAVNEHGTGMEFTDTISGGTESTPGTKILNLVSYNAGYIPAPSALMFGQLSMNVHDGRVFFKRERTNMSNPPEIVELVNTNALSSVLDMKVDKIGGFTDGNLAMLVSGGGIADSGVDVDSFATAAQGALAATSLQPGADISLLANDAGFVTGGENIGTGEGLYLDVVGTDLRFKSLVGDQNVVVTSSGTEVSVSVPKMASLSEYVKVNYLLDGTVDTVESSDGVSATITQNSSSTDVLLEVTFTEDLIHVRPPSSIMVYGWSVSGSRYEISTFQSLSGHHTAHSTYFTIPGGGPLDLITGGIAGCAMTDLPATQDVTLASDDGVTPTHAIIILGW